MRPIFIALFCFSLTSCMPGKIDRIDISSSYAPEQYQFLYRSHRIVAEISGNPFTVTNSQFETLVNQAIGKDENIRTGYRVHLAFNGSPFTSRDHACQAQGGPPSRDGTLTLVAAFCPGSEEAATYLVASVSDIKGPEDPRFTAFIRWSVANLFPPAKHDDREDVFCVWPNC